LLLTPWQITASIVDTSGKNIWSLAVLRIRDVYPGSQFPDPDSWSLADFFIELNCPNQLNKE
jgi:hypothetical protein